MMRTSPLNALHGYRANVQALGRLSEKERKEPLLIVTISREAGAGAPDYFKNGTRSCQQGIEALLLMLSPKTPDS